MNPYWGSDPLQFLFVFFSRFGGLFSSSLASDEIQIFTLSCIAIACGVIGPFLVLQRMTMFANSLSHTVLLGVVGAFLLCGASSVMNIQHLIIGACLAALLTAFITEGLMKWFDLTEDASVGLCFTFLFALGVVASTLFLKDVHLGIESVMGNADILQISDLHLSGALVLINTSLIFLLYRPLKLISFDRNFAIASGLSPHFFRFFLLFLTAATCVGAFRAIGVLQVLAFLVGPYLAARLLFCRLVPQIIATCAIGVFASFCAVVTTRSILTLWDLPLSTGGMAIAWIGLFYGMSLLIRQIKYRLNFV